MTTSRTTAGTAVTRGRTVTAMALVGVVWTTCVLSCGARTGLYANRFDSLADAAADFDADIDGENPSCLYAPALDFMNGREAGTNCVGGPQLLLCDVAGNGNMGMNQFCLTNELNCSAVSDPECQAQCNSDEFGVRCFDSDAPVAPGCRILDPSPPTGPDGMVFCCTCS